MLNKRPEGSCSPVSLDSGRVNITVHTHSFPILSVFSLPLSLYLSLLFPLTSISFFISGTSSWPFFSCHSIYQFYRLSPNSSLSICFIPFPSLPILSSRMVWSPFSSTFFAINELLHISSSDILPLLLIHTHKHQFLTSPFRCSTPTLDLAIHLFLSFYFYSQH